MQGLFAQGLQAALASLRIELSAFYVIQTHITRMCEYTPHPHPPRTSGATRLHKRGHASPFIVLATLKRLECKR